jgi:hypothetical protein
LEFKLPKGEVSSSGSVHSHQPTRAFTATYSTEAKSSTPSSPTPSTPSSLLRGRSGTTLTAASDPPPLVSSKSAVTIRPAHTANNSSSTPNSPALDSDGLRRKLEVALAEILTLRNDRDKSVAEHTNTQMLYMAEKEKTEKLLAALRKLGAQSPPAPGSQAPTQANGAQSTGDVAALQAEVARLRSDLDTKTQVIAEQQQALDAYCVDEAQHADAQQLRAQLDAVRAENAQLYTQLESANNANAQLQASLSDASAAAAAAGAPSTSDESQERIIALEDRLTKLVSVVSVLMEQNRALKDRLGGQVQQE